MSDESLNIPASTRTPLASPRVVLPGRGAQWWSEAWRLFVAGVVPWLLIVVILVVLHVCLSLIPIVGHLASSVLTPVFVGGLMLGSRAADRGEALSVSHLFAGFSSHAGPLLVVGLLYTAFLIAILMIVAAILFMSFGAALLAQVFELQNPASAYPALGQMLYAVMVGVLLLLALLKWKRADARLLLALACVPHTTVPYETIPLFLIPQTWRQAWTLWTLAILAYVAQWWTGPYTSQMAYWTSGAQWIVALMYLPCLGMVLLRPNVGQVGQVGHVGRAGELGCVGQVSRVLSHAG